MVRTPFAWCLSPPKRNFPSVAVALPRTGQWIAHKWLDALKLRWSTRQAKTSAGLNMLQKGMLRFFDKTGFRGANTDSPCFKMSVLFLSVCKFCTCGSELHWRRSWRIRHHKVHLTAFSHFSTSDIDISKNKVDLEPLEPANCPQLRCNLSLCARLDRPFQNLTPSTY